MPEVATKRKKIEKKDIPGLRYGIIHSRLGFNDGVSIVISQMESAMVKDMNIPKENIFYLVGSAKNLTKQVWQNKIFEHQYMVNKSMLKYYEQGYGSVLSEKIEKSINKAKQIIKEFISKNNIDVIIAHNTSHPVNFTISVALSRYYKEQIIKNKRTPKYILWWHDSHLEIRKFQNPAQDAKKYLLQGVPGVYVEYIIFINSLQFDIAKNYFFELDKKSPGYYKDIFLNHDIICNTADTIINSLQDLEKSDFIEERTDKFLDKFKIRKLLNKRKLSLNDVQFCLQHSRIVPRKKIDHALKYCYELLVQLQERKIKKAMFFFVSGHSGDESPRHKKELINLSAKLAEEYKTNKLFLVFAEDYDATADISFKDFPYIFAKLGGIATFFSETEGFGNNLLEVLAGGLIPTIYTYPVFVKDIAKYKFKIVGLDKFKITPESINQIIEVIQKDRMKKTWVNENIRILKKRFSHRIIAPKMNKAITSKRLHI